MFVGHLGELALFGASMATSFAGVTSFSFLRWILCVGKLLEQSSTICWAYTCRDTGSILSLFGQDPEIAAEVGAYSRWMIPTLFAYGLIQCHNRFLQTQNIVFPMMLITSVTALLDLTFVDVSPEELFHNERSFMNEVSKASPMETQSAKEVNTNEWNCKTECKFFNRTTLLSLKKRCISATTMFFARKRLQRRKRFISASFLSAV
ncbi:hypothetical protein ZIOFF_059417 [Zingiber officinale]|uniref:Uncharacterized protein n=1 Tax=Zingiber officinale TaxID=94328 RepID=A0A8J5KML9_ZINOF|nr:hypothetical protein ZIOFF_059417 [Zingiber officinale]